LTALEAGTLAVGALALAFNVHFWLRAVRGYWSWRRYLDRRPDPRRWPRARVFVCLKGRLPRLGETMRSLDAQDYPGSFGVTFITEGSAEAGDESAQALRELLPGATRCNHVVAGRVLEHDARCAQKNWNLLAGIRHAEGEDDSLEVYAFCDGDLLVRPNWLREMVKPLATGAGQVSTSFHCVEPEGRRVLAALHGIAETCQSMAALVCRGAAWGGSMAILAPVFRRHRLEEIWSRTVVDDMTLSRVLQGTRLTVVPVPRFLVSSRSEIDGYRAFVRWLGRQYFFVRVYLPTMYRALGVKVALDVAALWLAAYHCAHAIVHGAWPAGALAGIGVTTVAASLLATFWLFRFLLPERPSVRAWIPASLLVPGASLLACADATFRRRRIIWRDLTYDVDRRGDVSRVYATGRPPVPGTDPGPLPEEAAA
jgi:cellulose synthase/poly-beta-1,6-N-acetylglucosamine synthase-like glycosyltransferase